MSNSKQHALEKLKSTYARAINSPNDRSFFISLYEYVDLFETDPLIEKARIAIFDEAKKDKAEVEKLGKKALKEIRANYQPIAEYVESKGVENEAITRSLQEYRDIESGTTQMSGNLVQNLYDCLAEVLYRLADDKNNNKFVDKFCSLEKSVNTKVLSFSPTFNLWKAVHSQYERVKHAKVWFSWDKLAFFHELYKRYEHVLHTDIVNKDYKAVMDAQGHMTEIHAILNGADTSSSAFIEYKESNYKEYLQRVHLFTLHAVENFSTSKQGKEISANYDKETKVITIKGMKVKFNKRGNRYRVLDVIMNSTTSKKKEWQNDELLEKLGFLEPLQTKVTAEKKKIIYDAAKGINSYIASKTGYLDFLIPHTDTTQLNPKYL